MWILQPQGSSIENCGELTFICWFCCDLDPHNILMKDIKISSTGTGQFSEIDPDGKIITRTIVTVVFLIFTSISTLVGQAAPVFHVS